LLQGTVKFIHNLMSAISGKPSGEVKTEGMFFRAKEK